MIYSIFDRLFNLFYKRKDHCGDICEDCISIILSYCYPRVRLVSRRWNILYQQYNKMKINPDLLRVSNKSVTLMSVERLRHILEYYPGITHSLYKEYNILELLSRKFSCRAEIQDIETILKYLSRDCICTWIYHHLNSDVYFDALTFINSIPYMQEMFTHISLNLTSQAVQKVEKYCNLRFSIGALYKFYSSAEFTALSVATTGRDVACAHEEYKKFVDSIRFNTPWINVWLHNGLMKHKKYYSD